MPNPISNLFASISRAATPSRSARRADAHVEAPNEPRLSLTPPGTPRVGAPSNTFVGTPADVRARADSTDSIPPPPPEDEPEVEATPENDMDLARLQEIEMMRGALDKLRVGQRAARPDARVSEALDRLTANAHLSPEHLQAFLLGNDLQRLCDQVPSERAYFERLLMRVANEVPTRKNLQVLTYDAIQGVAGRSFSLHLEERAPMAEQLRAMHLRLNDDLSDCPARVTFDYAFYHLYMMATGTPMEFQRGNGDFPNPRRLPETIDVLACARAARFALFSCECEGSDLEFARSWGPLYKARIPMAIDASRLTVAELTRLGEPGDKPEWNWLPGLQDAVQNAVAAAITAQAVTHMPPADPDLVQYEGQNRERVAGLVTQYLQPHAEALNYE